MNFKYAFAFAFFCGAISLPCFGAERPNVLLIMTDNQSYRELQSKGHPYVKTPHIDKFTANAVDLINYHAENFCSPSRASLMTGRYPMRAGVHDTVAGVSILSTRETTLADILSANGYATAIFGKWHLGMSYPYLPQHRGFQETFIHGGGGIGQLEDYYGNDHYSPHFMHNGEWIASEGFSSNTLFNRAALYMRAQQEQNKPFFCFISTPATHTPYQEEPVAMARIKARGVEGTTGELNLYSMIENIDDNVGAILKKLDDWDLRQNTLIIVTTDQGIDTRVPLIFDKAHGDALGSGRDSRHQIFCMLQMQGLTVPHQSDALTGIVDLAPTILDVCGIEPPANMDGRSLKPILQGAKRWDDDRTLILQCPRKRVRDKWTNAAVKTQRWRLLSGGRLFDIEADPEQRRDVSGAHPEVVAKLTNRYDAFWKALPNDADNINRHPIGHPLGHHTLLGAMDWHWGSQSKSPWTQNSLRSYHSGGWKITVVRAATYRFELRRYMKETPLAIGAVGARLKIGAAETSCDLTADDTVATLEMTLEPGDYDAEAFFTPPADSKRKETWGAYFIDVTALD